MVNWTIRSRANTGDKAGTIRKNRANRQPKKSRMFMISPFYFVNDDGLVRKTVLSFEGVFPDFFRVHRLRRGRNLMAFHTKIQRNFIRNGLPFRESRHTGDQLMLRIKG